MSWVVDFWNWLPEVIQILVKIVAIVLPLMLMVAYYTLLERKVISYMQVRIGPNRVGIKGSLQPIADALKLMFKEIVLPTRANKFLFLLAPMLGLGPALAAWAVFPFNEGMVLADVAATSSSDSRMVSAALIAAVAPAGYRRRSRPGSRWR